MIFVRAYRRAKAIVRAYTRSKTKRLPAMSKVDLARKASDRSRKIQSARLKALDKRSYNKFRGI